MAESGATLLRRASSRSGWRSSSAGFIKRFRKPVVGASLTCGALVAAFAAIWSSDALIRLAGLLPPNTRLIVVPFLVLTLFSAGLYTDLGQVLMSDFVYVRAVLRALSLSIFLSNCRLASRAIFLLPKVTKQSACCSSVTTSML